MATQEVGAKAAAVVRKALEDNNHTQEWLSVKTGIPMRTLARRLHKTNPSGLSLDELGIIASALGTDIVSLLITARSVRPGKAATS